MRANRRPAGSWTRKCRPVGQPLTADEDGTVTVVLPTVHVPRYRKLDRRFRRTVGEVRSSVRFATETLDADTETKKRLNHHTRSDWK